MDSETFASPVCAMLQKASQFHHLEIDQTALVWVLLWRSCSEWVVAAETTSRSSLCWELLLWCLAEEWVVASFCGFQSSHRSCTRAVHKRARCGVLGRNTQIANVSESVLSLARSQQRVKLGLIRVNGWSLCLLWLDRRGSRLRCCEVLDRIRSLLELLRRLLFA